MGTKRPSCTLFDTLTNINTSERKLQPGGRISQDPSPRPAMTAQSERERDSNREEDRRREREAEKMRDKTRYKSMDPWDRYSERDRAPAPRPREGEKERTERVRRQEDDRRRNGRPLSSVEKESLRELERGTKKGDTFPRIRKSSPDRGRGIAPTRELDKEREERRQRDGPRREPDDWERERDRTWQRERYREKERDEIRSRGKEEGTNRTVGRPIEDDRSRKMERYLEPDAVFQDRRREGDNSRDRRERDAARKREKLEPNKGGREVRVPSAHGRREREMYSDRGEGRRDTRSEGDSDEIERKRERVRIKHRQELTYHHSKSEGDNKGKTQRDKDRDKQGYRDEDRNRYRDREAYRTRRKGGEKDTERYREADRRVDREGDRGKESVRDLKDDRREEDRYRDRGRETKEREADPSRDDMTGSRSISQNETAPRVPPRAQSSGEWSSDMDSDIRYRRGRDKDSFEESGKESDRDAEDQRNPGAERNQSRQTRSEGQERDRGEMTGQRRMWLEPQRDKNRKDELVDRQRGKERRRYEDGSLESQAEWEREGRRVTEEPYDKYLPESSNRGRREGRNRSKGDTGSEGVSVDGEDMSEVWRERDEGGMSNNDRGKEGRQRRDAEGESVTLNTEESDREEDGGRHYRAQKDYETGWSGERDRVQSGEDGFVTLSSGGDDEDEREEDEEEEFEDCREFLESSHDGIKLREGEEKRGLTMGKEEGVDEEEEKKPKYVFCVIGQTLPRSDTSKMSPSQDDHMGGQERHNPNMESCDEATQDDGLRPIRNYEKPVINNQEANRKSECDMPGKERPASEDTNEVNVRYREAGGETRSKGEHPYAEIGAIRRESQTEKLLQEWRNKNKEGVEEEQELDLQLPSNPYSEVGSQVNFKQIQPILDGINTEAMSPEEVEAIRIRMSGAWSMSEEPKRHSQAPHLKWAKNVLWEILGHSEEHIIDEANLGQPGVNQLETANKNMKQHEEVVQGTVRVPVLQLSKEQHSEPELEEEEPVGVEELRDDEDDRSKSWGEVELRNVLDTIDRRKRNSKFFNAAQLYQQYNEAAQNIEILRQAGSNVISVCEDIPRSPVPSPPPARRPLPPIPPVPHPHSLSHSNSITSVKSLPLPEPPKHEGRPSSPRLSISLTQSASLWRELPGVRNSVELVELTDDQRRLQEVRFEVVTSEASYCRSLDIVVEHFVKSKQLGALLASQDRNWLFSRLADVRAISHSFLAKLEERVESDTFHFTVCDIIAWHCQRFKLVYVPYLTNQSYQDATYQRLMEENPGFRRIVEKLERSPVCQRLPLRSFLVLPFQRIIRIRLLVQNIVKRTTPGTAEATQAIKALKLLEKLIQESNDSITQMKSIESLVSLSAKVGFECRTLPLISQSRRMVREGLVTELMDFSLKDTERNIYLHLFNDYLLISLQKEGGRFTVIDHSPVSDLRAENCRVKLHTLQKNLFRLHMTNRALLLRTDKESDKLRWISALSRPHPEIDFSAAEDFTQMQCIRAIVGHQPDELSLEKADIILVHQQSSDHWVEGTRLSDRHRGWVPDSHLETITNSKVRQRNLSDAIKLTTATAEV
ncbi:trichohyalin isoform X2 [Eleginops maclovinus]|uniref:trichohyalin isoform X2 n=1 Tax=Eleginops maclovinus TaxID=56733 RepID=UPI0030810AB7